MLTIAYQYPYQLISSTYDFNYTGDASDIDDPFDACDNAGTFLIARAYRDSAIDTSGKFHFSLTPPPQNVLISKLSLYARCFTTAGTDYWSGDASTIRGHLKPAGASSDYAGVAAANFVSHWNQNQQPGGPAGVDFFLLGDWLTNPFTTAAWTLQDLATLQAAYEVYIQSGESAQGGLVGGCVTQLYVRLECVPTAANLEPMRALGSMHLRLFRNTDRRFPTVHGLEAMEIPLLAEVEPSHALAPTPRVAGREVGWRTPPGSRPRMIVVGKKIDLMASKVTLDLLDLRDASCTFWASWVQDIGFTTDYQGVPIVSCGGGGPAIVRAQTDYVQRPGDELVVDCPEGVMKVALGGLHVEGEVKNWLLNSCFGLGSGIAFTSWTNGVVGGGSHSAELGHFLVDLTGQRRAAKVACDATAGSSAYLEQTTASIDAHGRVVVWYRHEVPGATPHLGVNIRRLSDNWYWNDATGAWTPSLVDNYFPASTVRAKWISKPFDTEGAATVRIRVGYGTQSPGTSNQSGWIYSCELITCGDTTFPPAAGTPIVNTSTTITRAKDDVSIPNPPGARIWDHRYGRVVLKLAPNWGDADLAADQEKMLLSVTGLGSGGTGYMALLYERVSGVSYWTLRMHDGTSATNLRLSTSGHAAAYGQQVTLGALWTSALDEMEHGASIARLWVHDVGGLAASAALAKPAGWDALAMAAGSMVWLGPPGGSSDQETYPDAVYKMLDLDVIVPETDSLLRWMGAQ